MNCANCKKEIVPGTACCVEDESICEACYETLMAPVAEGAVDPNTGRVPDTFLQVNLGNTIRRFQIGNFLNSIDEVVQAYMDMNKGSADINNDEMMKALKLYIEFLGG